MSANLDLVWLGTADGRGQIARAGPAVDVRAAAFQHGRGLFETMRIATVDGAPRVPLWSRHLDRLRRSAPDFGLPPPPGPALAAAAAELIGAAGLDDGVLRLTAGASSSDPGGAVFALTLRTRSTAPAPLTLHVAQSRRAISDPTARHKTTSRAFWDQVQREAGAAGCDEALVLDSEGGLAETATGTLFCLLDGHLHTPSLDGPLLPGVARSVLLDGLAADEPVRERRLTAAALLWADAFWVSNAIHGPRRAVLGASANAEVPAASPAVAAAHARLCRAWAAALGPPADPPST